MKQLIFNEIKILSFKERKAKKITLNKEGNLITGPNGTGKSTLLKSIYYAFGAEAPGLTKEWKSNNPVISVKFTVDHENFSIMRMNNTFAIFDENSKLLKKCESVTNELGPFLANLLDYKIQIKDRQQKTITPPPQYMFLPFYIDQDSSWSSPWSGFERTQQLPKWKSNIIDYTTGIKTNKHYDLKKQLNDLEIKFNEYKEEEESLAKTLETIKDNFGDENFEINLDDFKTEIKKLLSQTSELRESQNKTRVKLISYHNMRSSILEQIAITKEAIKEISDDYEYATKSLTEEEIHCPTCGEKFDNNFADRFEIAKDENTCKDLLISLQEELNDVNEKINKVKDDYDKKLEQINSITDILRTEKGEMQLNEILQMQGRKKIKSVINQKISKAVKQKTDVNTEIKQIRNSLEEQKKDTNKTDILQSYSNYVNKYSGELGVKESTAEKASESILANFSATGSELPRSLLAYYFSILQIMRENYSATFCPIVIDSPNQQDQDKGNIKKIYEFIKNNVPKNSQVILAVADTYGIDFQFEKITLKNEYSLLVSSEFDAVNKEMRKEFNQIIGL